MRKKIQVLLITLIVILVCFLIIKSSMRFFRAEIPTGSMVPTLNINDQLLVKKIEYCKIKRGDILVFEKDNTLYVKRLIGLPGDIVYIDNGDIYVNGCILNEPYIYDKGDYSGQYIVPEGNYFFLGDNRVNSFDSRYWDYPFVSKEHIVGKACFYLKPHLKYIQEVYYEVF